MMTLKNTATNKTAGNVPKNYATFEHLHRRRDGGAGMPNNVVLACRVCNNGRDHGVQLTPTSRENAAAKGMCDSDLIAGAHAGTLSAAACGELFKRRLVPNWPHWTALVMRDPAEWRF